MPAPTMPPGWYTDNQSPQLLRWWNGQQWTSATTPAPDNPAARSRLARHPRLNLRRSRIRTASILVGAGFSALVVAGSLQPAAADGAAPTHQVSPTATATPSPAQSTTPSATPSPTPTETAPVITEKKVVLAYKVTTKKNETLPEGKRKTVRAGVKGLRIDTYSDGIMISSQVVTNPVNKVVSLGTKPRKSSNSSGMTNLGKHPDDGSSSIYYRNCAAARAAGAAPVRRGEPGYGRHLDRDGDGVGCE